MGKTILSIIIPVYNVELYLQECLDSLVFNKSKSREIEILLIDDGSTDNSGLMCDEYSQKYSYIHVFHKKNGGLSSARNFGISKATGEWITFMDSDDVVVSNYLDIIFRLIDQKIDIVLFKYRSFTNNVNCPVTNYNIDSFSKTSKRQAMYLITTEEWGNFAWNKLYKKSLFKNIRYPVSKNYEDIYTTFKLINKAKSFATYNKSLYLYRIRNGSITNTNNVTKALRNNINSLEAREQQLSFFMDNNYVRAYNNAHYYYICECFVHIDLIIKNKLKKDSRYYKCLSAIGKANNIFNFSNINKIGFNFWIKQKICIYFPNIYAVLIKVKNKIKK